MFTQKHAAAYFASDAFLVVLIQSLKSQLNTLFTQQIQCRADFSEFLAMCVAGDAFLVVLLVEFLKSQLYGPFTQPI